MAQSSTQTIPDESELLRRQAAQAFGANRAPEAVALLEKAHALNPNSPEICTDFARVLWRMGRHHEANEYFVKAAGLAPAEPYILNSYGVFLMHHMRYDEAQEMLTRALQLKPGFHEILNNLGMLHHRRGDWPAAEEYFLQAIRANPALPAAHGNLAALLRDMKQNDRAETEYREALKYAPGNLGGWQVLADFYQSTGQYDKALEIRKRLLSQAPFNENAWIAIFDMQEKMSRLDDARATVADFKARFPQSAAAAIVEARLLRRAGSHVEALSLLKGLRPFPEESPPFRDRLFEMGLLHDLLGDADAAFECFKQANASQMSLPSAARVDGSAFIDRIARYREQFTPAVAAAVTSAAAGTDTSGPVFIVGFPRSGTTLLDQILSSHPRVTVADEEPVTNRMTMYLARKYGGEPPSGPEGYESGYRDWLKNNSRYPGCLAEVTDADAAEMRRIFFASHGVQEGGDGVFVDKLPMNSHHAALIHRVFPKAKFILALRHPCDSVLSCFMQQFHLNNAMASFSELQSGARLYNETFRLWDLYTQLLPLQVHAVRYEDVVADFRPTVAKLLDFLELDWNDAVLEYDKTARKRAISTPSYHQVTEKIYTRASGRWQRYRKHMQDVIPLLEPYAKKYGYSMDESDAQE